MTVAAVICEFNPFHNGHKYILDKARSLTNADYLIAVMSGNYVQRGEPAVMDKFTRTRMALLCGADLVLELPSCFSTASASEFASAGVSLCFASGIADHLVFGAEEADLKALSGIAHFLSDAESGCEDERTAEFNRLITSFLSSGSSYPAARSAALGELGFDGSLISSPNNILACEYLKAIRMYEKIKGTKARIRPVAVSRIGDSFNSELPLDAHFTSATAIRRILKEERDSAKSLAPYVPSEIYDIYKAFTEPFGKELVLEDSMSELLNYRLIELFDEGYDFSLISDVSEALAARMKRTALKPMVFSDRIQVLKTKDLTYSRISRALLHTALGMTKEDFNELKSSGYIKYIRILGFRRCASELLSEMKKSSSVPLITKVAANRELMKDQIKYDNIYYSLLSRKGLSVKNEFEREIVIL